ncbi:MAG TPA: hypothetical protein VMV23_07060 [Candidatus Nanopelagicaceae bacterium]|nr:hypothetical protein [Candidatus Nanopelagicaceae bacterium]
MLLAVTWGALAALVITRVPLVTVPLLAAIAVVSFYFPLLAPLLKWPDSTLNISLFHLDGEPLTSRCTGAASGYWWRSCSPAWAARWRRCGRARRVAEVGSPRPGRGCGAAAPQTTTSLLAGPSCQHLSGALDAIAGTSCLDNWADLGASLAGCA